MNKKVSLKEIVGTKIVYAIILTSYYWMWARTDWKDWYETVQSMLGVFLFSFFTLYLLFEGKSPSDSSGGFFPSCDKKAAV